MSTALRSAALPTNMASETNTFRFWAIAIAWSIFLAYCNISRHNSEIGVRAFIGIVDFPALIVTVSPSKFIPESTPIIPPHV